MYGNNPNNPNNPYRYQEGDDPLNPPKRFWDALERENTANAKGIVIYAVILPCLVLLVISIVGLIACSGAIKIGVPRIVPVCVNVC